MSFDWQNLIVLAAIGAAVTYLGRMMWQTFARKSSACGGCSSCPSADANRPEAVVGIEQLAASVKSPTRAGAGASSERSSL
jgi:hypothetical protein